MPGHSIFLGVARNENAHTELLCNFLVRYPSFWNLFYRFLTGAAAVPMELMEPQISTQWDCGDDGRPDIHFHFPNALGCNFVVEVKVREDTGLTARQREGYQGLVYYLIPRRWKYTFLLKGSRHFWEQLIFELRKDPEISSDDVLISEYLMFLDIAFPSIQFGEEERKLLTETNAKLLVSTALKLHMIVDAVADHFRRREFKVSLEGSADEYGYRLSSKNNGSDILWFGMWASKSLLLGAGYEAEWHKGWAEPGFHLRDKKWWLIDLGELLVDQDNEPTNMVIERIQSLLDSLTMQKS